MSLKQLFKGLSISKKIFLVVIIPFVVLQEIFNNQKKSNDPFDRSPPFKLRFSFQYRNIGCLWPTNNSAYNKYGHFGSIKMSDIIEDQYEKNSAIILPTNIIEKINTLNIYFQSSLDWSNLSGESLWNNDKWVDFLHQTRLLYDELCMILGEDYIILYDQMGSDKLTNSNYSAKPKIRFMLEYGTSHLWTADDYTDNIFSSPFEEDDFILIGLTKDHYEFAMLLDSLYWKRLNSPYESFPSLWSGKMCLFFQSKLKEFYDSIVLTIGDKFEIINSDKDEMFQYIDVEKIDYDLKIFVNDPVAFCKKEGVTYYGDKKLRDEIKELYKLWKIEEEEYLKGFKI